MESEEYFIDNLHLLFNKPNLLLRKDIDGDPLEEDFRLRGTKEDKEKIEIETLLERLRIMFQTFGGGGKQWTLDDIKEMIRKKVKKIRVR
jgi:ADP-heptose:LPS heptosyltransferase